MPPLPPQRPAFNRLGRVASGRQPVPGGREVLTDFRGRACGIQVDLPGSGGLPRPAKEAEAPRYGWTLGNTSGPGLRSSMKRA